MTTTQQDFDPDKMDAILDSHLAQLSEHFDSVRIFWTKYDSDSSTTKSNSRGIGDWYAQSGAVREWLIRSEEDTRLDCRSRLDDP